jgi:hypothetical protein
MLAELAIGGGLLLAQWAYHRWWEDRPQQKKPPNDISIPRTDDGAVVPLLFGRTLVRQPLLVYARCVDVDIPDSTKARAHLLYVVAIGCDDGRGTNRAHGLWRGDEHIDPQIEWSDYQSGNGGPEPQITMGGGTVEVLNGNQAQVLANDGDTQSNAPTYAGRAMLMYSVPHAQIPGYRGYLSVFLYGWAGSITGWVIPKEGEKAYAFEASSYHTSHAQLAALGRVGLDMNPANMIYLLLIQKFGALGIDSSKIDLSSFLAAQYKLYTESFGLSLVVEDLRGGDEYIRNILRLIDGVLDEDPIDGLIKIKLVRPDFDPNTIPEINRSNAVRLEGFAAGGWSDVVNKIRVVYTDRNNGYRDGSVMVHNQANSTVQSSDEELVLTEPMIHYESLARSIANRELAARSRPLIKCRAICGRWAIRLMRGDPVRLTWANPDVSGLVFRVANVERGTLEDGHIAVDLVQDYMYTWRNQTPRPPVDVVIENPPVNFQG